MRTGSVSREDIAESVLYVDDGKMGISRIHKAHTLLMKAQTLIKEPEAQLIVRRVVELRLGADRPIGRLNTDRCAHSSVSDTGRTEAASESGRA